MTNSLSDNFAKVCKITGLIPLNKNNDIYSRVEFSESKVKVKNVSVSYPAFLNGFIRSTFKYVKKGVPLKLDETASKNYYLFVCAIYNYVGNKPFVVPVKTLAKTTFSGARDINSNTACINNLLYHIEFFNRCGLVHSEMIDDDNIRISEVCVPQPIRNARMNDWTISFMFDDLNEKEEFMKCLTIQAIDKNNIKINLTGEQLGYLRCAIDSNISIMNNLIEDRTSDVDLRIAYLAKMIDVFKCEYDKTLLEKHDIDSSLFSRTSLL